MIGGGKWREVEGKEKGKEDRKMRGEMKMLNSNHNYKD
jgi:hypothetical protein